MKKRKIHCEQCGPGQMQCPCDCHPLGVKGWQERVERDRRIRELEALGISEGTVRP